MSQTTVSRCLGERECCTRQDCAAYLRGRGYPLREDECCVCYFTFTVYRRSRRGPVLGLVDRTWALIFSITGTLFFLLGEVRFAPVLIVVGLIFWWSATG